MNKTKLAITLILFMLVVSVSVMADEWPKVEKISDGNFKITYENGVYYEISNNDYGYLVDDIIIKLSKIKPDEESPSITQQRGVYFVIWTEGGIFKKESIPLTNVDPETLINFNMEQADVPQEEEHQTEEEINENAGTSTEEEEHQTEEEINENAGTSTEEGETPNEIENDLAGIINKDSYNFITGTLKVNKEDILIDEEKRILRFKVDPQKADPNSDEQDYEVTIKTDENGGVIEKNYIKELEDGGIKVSTYKAGEKNPDTIIFNKDGSISKDTLPIEPLPNTVVSEEMEEQMNRLNSERLQAYQAIQKTSFINELNRLVEKYKEGGKEAFSEDEEELLFLKNAKNIAKNKYGIDENDLTYEQKVIIEHASQTYADIFYDSVRAARGGIALSNLLNSWLDWDFMMGWRKKSDEFFSQTVIGRVISGRWEESLCHKHIDRIPNNVAVVNVNGVMGFASHIEGERSESIATNNQTIYFYKITFAVNPQIDKEIKFEILIDGKKADLDNDGKADTITLKPGESYSGTGENAIVRYKDKIYKKVCIKFYNTENLNKEFTSSLKDNKLCNTIVETYVAPGSISKPAETAAGSGTASSSDAW